MSIEYFDLTDEEMDMDPEEQSEDEDYDVDRMFSFAEWYRNGTYVDQDLHEAFKWYEKAANAGHPAAMFNLGLFYAKGAGVSRDFGEAEDWMRKASRTGDEDAKMLAVFYKYAEKLRIMAESGYPQAQGDYAWVLMEIGKSMKRTYTDNKTFNESIWWAHRAEESEIDSAMWVLALAYFEGRGDIERDNNKALEYFEKGAASGHAGCIANVACYYMEGDIYEKNLEKGFSLFKEAAEKGYPEAMANLAKAYHFGLGTRQNDPEAYKWIEKAEENDQPYHMYVLSCLKSLKEEK